MLLPSYTNSIVFILIFVWTKADKEMDGGIMRAISPSETIECRDDSNKTIDLDIPSRYPFRLSDLMNGSVKIDFDHIPADHVLLRFVNDQSNIDAATNGINCWSSIADDSITVEKSFDESATQMFCLMEKEAKTVSPLDCLSILSKTSASDSAEDPIWLTEDDRALAIGLLAMGLTMCLVLGIVIGIVIVKRQTNTKKESSSSRSDLIVSDWNGGMKGNEVIGYPYTDSDTISVASDRSSYVPAVNPSRFDLIKMKLEKSEKAAPLYESQNVYDLEDMPSVKAPSAPEGFRDSGISTNDPIYAISAKVKDRNDDQSDNNGENLYLCVDSINDNNKKNE